MPILDTTKQEFLMLQSRKQYHHRFNSMDATKLSKWLMEITTPYYYFDKINKPDNDEVYSLAHYLIDTHPMIMVGDIHAMLSISVRGMRERIDKMNIECIAPLIPKYEEELFELIDKMNAVNS